MTQSKTSALPKVGSQTPTRSVAPKYEWTDGDDAIELADSYGLTLDPWQEFIINDWCGRDKLGGFASRIMGLAVPRQNGKNGVLEAFELKAMILDGLRILHTAHEVKTSQKQFQRMKHFFGEKAGDPYAKYPELNDLVARVRNTNGQEAIVLKNGGSIEFSARSRSSGRGFSVDIIVLDEAQELNDDHMEALTPTISASGDPILIMTGTPPTRFDLGTVFRKNRESALAGTTTATCWHEWSVSGIGDITDKRRWYETNPALGIRITETYIKELEIEVLSVDGFARERLGWWAEATAGSAAINYGKWEECSAELVPPGTVSYGVKFSPDGKYVSLAVALKPVKAISDKVHVEIIEHREMTSGISWLSEWLASRADKAAAIAIDGRSGVDALVESLNDRGVRSTIIQRITTKDAIAASSMFVEAIKSKQLTHYDQEALNASVKYAARRPIGKDGGFGFVSMDEAIDVTLLEAVSLAHYASKISKRRPGRKQKLI